MTTKVIISNAGPGSVRVNGSLLEAGQTSDGYVYDIQALVITEVGNEEVADLLTLEKLRKIIKGE